jgi:hypothetical protein
VWLLLATVAKLPVSTSHSIVGAMVGITVAIAGVHGIKWMKMVEIGRCEKSSCHTNASIHFSDIMVRVAINERRHVVCDIRCNQVYGSE